MRIFFSVDEGLHCMHIMMSTGEKASYGELIIMFSSAGFSRLYIGAPVAKN